jgi:hypothetical protein
MPDAVARKRYCLTGFFRLFYDLRYQICIILSAWALAVLTFFHLVIILIFEDRILMYIALNTT